MKIQSWLGIIIAYSFTTFILTESTSANFLIVNYPSFNKGTMISDDINLDLIYPIEQPNIEKDETVDHKALALSEALTIDSKYLQALSVMAENFDSSVFTQEKMYRFIEIVAENNDIKIQAEALYTEIGSNYDFMVAGFVLIFHLMKARFIRLNDFREESKYFLKSLQKALNKSYLLSLLTALLNEVIQTPSVIKLLKTASIAEHIAVIGSALIIALTAYSELQREDIKKQVDSFLVTFSINMIPLPLESQALIKTNIELFFNVLAKKEILNKREMTSLLKNKWKVNIMANKNKTDTPFYQYKRRFEKIGYGDGPAAGPTKENDADVGKQALGDWNRNSSQYFIHGKSVKSLMEEDHKENSDLYTIEFDEHSKTDHIAFKNIVALRRFFEKHLLDKMPSGEAKSEMLEQSLLNLHQGGVPHATNMYFLPLAAVHSDATGVSINQPTFRIDFTPETDGVSIRETNQYDTVQIMETELQTKNDIGIEIENGEVKNAKFKPKDGPYYARTIADIKFGIGKVEIKEIAVDCRDSRMEAVFDKRDLLQKIQDFIKSIFKKNVVKNLDIPGKRENDESEPTTGSSL